MVGFLSVVNNNNNNNNNNTLTSKAPYNPLPMPVGANGYFYSNYEVVYLLLVYYFNGRPQNFFQGWAMRGSEERKCPSRVQGQLPDGGLGAKPPEADDIFSK